MTEFPSMQTILFAVAALGLIVVERSRRRASLQQRWVLRLKRRFTAN